MAQPERNARGVVFQTTLITAKMNCCVVYHSGYIDRYVGSILYVNLTYCLNVWKSWHFLSYPQG